MKNNIEKDNIEKRYAIYDNYEIEIFIIDINNDGINVLEAILYRDGEVFNDIKSERYYTTVIEAIEHFKNVLIPEYLFSSDFEVTGEVKDFVLINNAAAVDMLVKKFLYDFRDGLYYNSVVDIITVLTFYGFLMPGDDEYSRKGHIDDYYRLVNMINSALIEKLKTIMFLPDRRVANKHDLLDEFNKSDFCKNIVFFRLPNIPGYRTINTAETFSRILKNDFLKNLDSVTFSAEEPEIYNAMTDLNEEVAVVNVAIRDTFNETSFNDKADTFKKLVERKRKKFVNYWSTQKPLGYIKFIEDYEKEIKGYV